MHAEHVTAALGGKWNPASGQGSACCPAHDDAHPSLSLTNGAQGQLVIKCHRGCDQIAVIRALADRHLWPEREVPVLAATTTLERNGHSAVGRGQPGEIVTTYDYRDEDGVLLYQAVRYAPKTFRQRSPDGRGGWRATIDGVRLVPYRLPELLAAAPTRHVFIVEGEKDADRLAALGLIATTNAMGAGKWRSEYSAFLSGRPVVILPDNDAVGRKHADDVAASVLPVASAVKRIALPGLAEHGDVSDWLDNGGTRAALETLVRAASPLEATGEAAPRYPVHRLGALLRLVDTDLAQLIDGVLWAERVHWAFAAPGAGKTLFLLAGGLHVAAGVPFCGRPVRKMPVLLVEEDSPFAVIAEYAEMLADIYGFDLDALPFFINQEQGLRLTDAEGPSMVLEAIGHCPERPGLVLLDACERLVPSEKFTSKELDPLTRLLQHMVTSHITPAVIDHTRRPGKKDDETPTDPMELLYGGRAKSASADIMMHFAGTPRTQMRVSYVKFRGEPPPPLDLTFAPDTGFALKEQPREARTPTEQKLLAWFANRGREWQSFEDILAATTTPERSVYRALEALTKRHWLEKDGTKKQGTSYRSHPIAAAFED